MQAPWSPACSPGVGAMRPDLAGRPSGWETRDIPGVQSPQFATTHPTASRSENPAGFGENWRRVPQVLQQPHDKHPVEGTGLAGQRLSITDPEIEVVIRHQSQVATGRDDLKRFPVESGQKEPRRGFLEEREVGADRAPDIEQLQAALQEVIHERDQGFPMVFLRQQPLFLHIRIAVDVGIVVSNIGLRNQLNRAYGIARLRTSKGQSFRVSSTNSFGDAPQNHWGHLGRRNSGDRSYLNGVIIACGELHVELVAPGRHRLGR